MKEGEDERQKDETPKAEQMDVSMTIVTGRKVVIDKETGQIRFEEVPPSSSTATPSTTPPAADAAQAQEASTAPEQQPAGEHETSETPTAEQQIPPEAVEALAAEGAPDNRPTDRAAPATDTPPPTAAAPEEPVELERTMAFTPEAAPAKAGATEAQPAPQADAPKENKRLSAETLYAFALPEAVLKEAQQSAKGAAKSQPAASSGSMGTRRSGGGMLSALTFLFVLLAGAAAIWYFLVGRDSGTQTAATEDPQVVQVDVGAEKPPAEQPKAEEPAKALDLPADPVTVEQASSLSVEQLAALAKRTTDQTTRLSLIKEAGNRKDPALTQALLPLAKSDSYQVRAGLVRLFVDKQQWEGLPQDQITATLLALLDDPDEIVRAFSAKALSQSGDKSALPKLRARLDIETSDVVIKVVRQTIQDLS